MNKEQHIEKLATKINDSVYHKGSYNQARDLATIAYEYFNPVEKGEDLVAGVQNSEGAAVASHSSTSQSAIEQNQCPNFPFFGAKYPDAGCFDGFLRDLDHCDSNGLVYEHDDNWPCPFCNTEAFIKRFAEDKGMKYKDVRVIVKKLKEKHGFTKPNSEQEAQGSDTSKAASSTNADNQANTVPIQKYEKLEEALNKINQFSDPGSYEKAIIEMKRIAGLALEK